MKLATRFQKLVSGLAVTKSGWESVFTKNLESQVTGGDVAKKPYSNSDIVYVCISTSARAVAQVPMVVMTADGERRAPVPPDDPWQRLFRKPNPNQDPYRFVESIISHYMLDGNVWIYPFPEDAPVPLALYVVQQRFMEPVLEKETGQLLAWKYSPGGKKAGSFLLKPERTIHLATFNPYDPILGQKPLEAGGIFVRTDHKAASYNEKFFDNAAVPAGVISAPEKVSLSDPQFDRLQERVEAMHRGYKKAHRMLYLERGLQFTQLGLSQKDMDYPGLRRMSRGSIMQCLGMKRAIIGETEDVNYSTNKEQRKEWWETTLLPMMTMLTWGINHRLLSDPAEVKSGMKYASFDLSVVSALKEDMSAKVETGQKLWNMGFTANEINQKLELGFKEQPWRDRWWAQMNLVPIGADSDLAQPLTPQGMGGGMLSVSDGVKKEEDEPVEEEDFQEEVHETGKSISMEPIPDSLPVWERHGMAAWKGLVVKTLPVEDQFKSKLRRSFYDMRKRSMKLLRDYGNISGLMNEHFDREKKDLVKWTRPLYVKAVRIGVESGADSVGAAVKALGLEKGRGEMVVDVDFMMEADPKLLAYIESKMSKITGLAETVKRHIHTQLSDGVKSGESIDQLSERIRSVYSMASTRAKTIARTEVVGASNMGRSEVLTQSGFTKKIWYTALDERVRDSHAKMHGESVDMKDAWALPGGGSVRYPGDYGAGLPAETINCRCIEQPDLTSVRGGTGGGGGGGTGTGTPKPPAPPPPAMAPSTGVEPKELTERLQQISERMQKASSVKAVISEMDTYMKEGLGMSIADSSGLDNARGFVEDAVQNGRSRGGGNVSLRTPQEVEAFHLLQVKEIARQLGESTPEQRQFLRKLKKESRVDQIVFFDKSYSGADWWRYWDPNLPDANRPPAGWYWMNNSNRDCRKINLSPMLHWQQKTFNKGRASGLMNTLIHEAGHGLNWRHHFQMGKQSALLSKEGDEKRTFYMKAFKLKNRSHPWSYKTSTPLYRKAVHDLMTFTDYGATDPLEDFAEMFKLRMNYPVRFQSLVSNQRQILYRIEGYKNQKIMEDFDWRVDFINRTVEEWTK